MDSSYFELAHLFHWITQVGYGIRVLVKLNSFVSIFAFTLCFFFLDIHAVRRSTRNTSKSQIFFTKHNYIKTSKRRLFWGAQVFPTHLFQQ